jgi:DNA processing protein
VDLPTAVAFSLLAGVARARVAAVVREMASADETVRRLAALSRREPAVVRDLLEAARAGVGPAMARARQGGIEPIPLNDPRYPPLLAAIYDPPPVLWCRGAVGVLVTPTVALVGARAASGYGRDVAARLGEELARRGVTVVSGLARGVDGAAHRGAVAGSGPTIAVLGSGADVIYPQEHHELAGQISRRGAIVSELPPGTAPLPGHFPLRNRIISGLSLAVVVIEASERSGSLITASAALDQGRDVMAVPGNVLSGRHRGAHALIRDGAKLVEQADDILEELGWCLPAVKPARDSKSLTDEPLLAFMQAGEDYALDELEALSGVAGSSLLPRLLELELGGRVARTESGRFERVLT